VNIIPDPRLLIVQAGGFILLLIVFKVFLWKPIMGVLDARRSEIENQYGDAEKRRREAEELKASYERHMAQIHEETRAKITEALKEGQAMRDEIIADSRAQADRILTRAEEEIKRERDKAMHELRTRVVDLTVEATARLIGERLDDEKHRKLVDRFIDDLEGAKK
jgi:F-type H+-transporting ATPase subunit b